MFAFLLFLFREPALPIHATAMFFVLFLVSGEAIVLVLVGTITQQRCPEAETK